MVEHVARDRRACGTCQVGTLLQDRLLAEIEARSCPARRDRSTCRRRCRCRPRCAARHCPRDTRRSGPARRARNPGGTRADRGSRRRRGGRSRRRAAAPASCACRRSRYRRRGPALRPARRPSAARETRARSRPSCTCPASARRPSDSSTPAGATARKRVEQQVGIVRDRRDAIAREEIGKEPHHHLAVLEHVRHARRHAQVVLEHVELACRPARTMSMPAICA